MDLDTSVDIREDDERVTLDVTGPDAGRAIGRKGQTLDALQFLVNKIVNRFPRARRHVIVDSGDYRERHDDGLISMAAPSGETRGRPGQGHHPRADERAGPAGDPPVAREVPRHHHAERR